MGRCCAYTHGIPKAMASMNEYKKKNDPSARHICVQLRWRMSIHGYFSRLDAHSPFIPDTHCSRAITFPVSGGHASPS